MPCLKLTVIFFVIFSISGKSETRNWKNLDEAPFEVELAYYFNLCDLVVIVQVDSIHSKLIREDIRFNYHFDNGYEDIKTKSFALTYKLTIHKILKGQTDQKDLEFTDNQELFFRFKQGSKDTEKTAFKEKYFHRHFSRVNAPKFDSTGYYIVFLRQARGKFYCLQSFPNKSEYTKTLMNYINFGEEGISPYFLPSKSPQNLYHVNTNYDDYNLAGYMWLNYSNYLTFSTNRFSKGGEYDFVTYEYYTHYIHNLNFLEFLPDSNDTEYILKCNTKHNEFGPFYFNMGCESTYNLFLFTREDEGKLDNYILKIHNPKSRLFRENIVPLPTETNYLPVKASPFNTVHNDGYIALDTQSSDLYFCSDRNGDYDLFSVKMPQIAYMTYWPTQENDSIIVENIDLYEWFTENTWREINSMDDVNSIYDDKCPFPFTKYISNQHVPFVVFTSNREGSLGGFDLYYSKFENEEWIEPINMGLNFNTEFNEYRPIVYGKYLFFSSNRPGGKGGYDLYIVDVSDYFK